MKKIGLFGGSFDPFTVAHMAIVESVLKNNLVDTVTILPTIVDYHRPGKEKWLTDSEKFMVIYEFTRRSEFQDRIYLDFQELGWKKDGTLSEEEVRNWRFIDTLKRVRNIYENSDNKTVNHDEFQFYTILGTDSVRNFKTWYRWDDILSLCELIGVEGRDGMGTNTTIPYISVRIPDEYSNVSSSKIREKFNNVYDYMKSIFGEKK
jgi:nicotinate-nucleotide adenylyltransferase